MLIKMIQNNSSKITLLLLLVNINFYTHASSEVMILSKCMNSRDGFIKNEYILDFEKSLMIRNYIYDSKTYKKYKITDLSIKKENSIEHFIYEDKGFFLTDKIGYPQFFTQLIFEKNNKIVQIKTVINNEVGISKLSTCKKVEIFEKES